MTNVVSEMIDRREGRRDLIMTDNHDVEVLRRKKEMFMRRMKAYYKY